MHKYRILFVMLQLDAGGSERVVCELLEGLDPLKYEPYVAAFNGGILEKTIRKFSKKLFFIKKGRRLDFFAIYKLSKIIRENNIDIVNAHHFMPFFYSFFGACIINKKRLVYTEHSCAEVESLIRSFYGLLFKCMLREVGAVIGVSFEIANTFKKYYPSYQKKIVAVNNGVDIQKFSKNTKHDNIREKYGIKEDHFVIGCVANFRKVKNHACLLRAVAELRKDYGHIRLLFVGSGFENDPENSENILKDIIVNLSLSEIVVFAGYQEEIPAFLAAFDLFCLPSFSEGLPMCIIEAMAAGVPVIGSNVKGIIEVINDRKNGILFESDNHKMLSICIKELIDNIPLRNTISREAKNYVKEKHDKIIWINKYQDALCNF